MKEMKESIRLTLLIVIFITNFLYADIRPFNKGEKLIFSVEYGPVKAGTAIMEITEITLIDSIPSFHIVSTERTNAFFSKIYKIDDRYDSYIDTVNLHSLRFEKHIREGSYKKDQIVEFKQDSGKVVYCDGREFQIEPGAKDIIASIYFARTLDLEVGKSYFINNHTDGKNYNLEVNVLKKERVETPAGEFDCLVIQPLVEEGKVFASREGLKIWLTDDSWKIPVLIRSKIMIGSIQAKLTEAYFE
ncbi:DUF3108 domain-containing protein [candidate division WOR-3 bacterium]|nr:DUF3108 domain-containing protein [candidate division WOR-3 bacterium]MCK4576429.1 DUF3108 domain-containing protein [candidate division WOR-3 bacterium]